MESKKDYDKNLIVTRLSGTYWCSDITAEARLLNIRKDNQ